MENNTIILLVIIAVIIVILFSSANTESFCNCMGMQTTKSGRPTYYTYRSGDVSNYGSTMNRGWGVSMPSDAFAMQQQGSYYTPYPDKVVNQGMVTSSCLGGPNNAGYATMGGLNGDGSAMSYSAMGGGCNKMVLEPVKLLSNGLPQNYVGPAGSFTNPALNNSGYGSHNLGGGKGCPSSGMYDLGVGVL